MENSLIDRIASYLLAPFESMAKFVDTLLGAVHAITDFGSKTAWLYLFTSLVAASVIYYVEKPKEHGASGSLIDFLFPRSIYLHRSAIVDYKFALIDLTIKGIVYTPLFSGLSMIVYKVVAPLGWVLAAAAPFADNWLAGTVAVSLAIMVATDFGFFFTHYLMHKIPVLWYFHEVHHSAEVLTPITAYRSHPVEDMVGYAVGAVLSGFGAAFYAGLSGNHVELPQFFGINIILFLFFSFAFQLRHSHIWLSYGPLLNRIFISPAQHQIHHSRAQLHWDKNFGFTFALWDWMWGTLYVPKMREKIHYGVPGTDPNDFLTVWKLYAMPFVKAKQWLRGRWFLTRRRPA